MRIVISNPDNLGDVMLREPLFAAVHEAGHELMLVVRDFVAPLAMDIAPYAEIAVCTGNPYLPNFVLSSALDSELAKQVQRFSPTLLVVAAYQYTELEQQLAALLPGAEVVGFSGHMHQPLPNVVAPSTIQFQTKVQVSIDTPEPTKNELLCGAILGKRATLRGPSLSPTETGQALAANHLKKIGLHKSPFWAVCAGDRPPWGLKNWEREKWIELCRTLIERHNVRILFIGTPEEDADTKAIQAALGLAARHTASITGEPITISELVGLLHAAQGYIGKDTGPMHLAAALGKPVVAVFGGGHWPRFVPVAKTGAVFSVDVPCKGCNWVCRLQRSHCVKDIPLGAVLDVVEKLVKGNDVPFYVDLLPREGLLEAEMFREMYEQAQSAYQLLGTERANFEQWHNDRLRDIAQLTSRTESAKQEGDFEARTALAVEIASRDRAITEANHRIHQLETEVVILTTNSREAREERGVLTRQLGEGRFQADKLEIKAAALVQTNADLSTRLGLAEVEKTAAAQTVVALESEISQTLVTVAKLQSDIDTVESRHLGRISDLERSLALQKRDNQVALTLIPELRTELISAQNEVDVLRASLREVSHRLRVMAGEQAQGDGWKENLSVLESLFAEANENSRSVQSEIEEFSAQVLAAAGEQPRGEDWRKTFADVRPMAAEGIAFRVWAQGEIDDFTFHVRATAGEQAVGGDWRENLRVVQAMLESAGAFRQWAQAEITELTYHVRATAGEQATGGDWREDLQAVQARLESAETFRQWAQAEITELTYHVRATAGEQATGGDWREDLQAVQARLATAESQRQEGQREIAAFTALLRATAGDRASASGWRENLVHVQDLLESAENWRQGAQHEIAEFAARLRFATGAEASGADWRRNLDVIETDRKNRLEMILELHRQLEEQQERSGHLLRAAEDRMADCTAQIRHAAGKAAASADWHTALSILEKDRTSRGEQIASLHRHIAHLDIEKEAQSNRVPIRILKTLRIL